MIPWRADGTTGAARAPDWVDMSETGPSLQTFSTGTVVAIVGFFSSFPILLQGLANMGADEGQAASALMAAAVAMGLAGIGLSLWLRQPISVAWSTPGAAFLAIAAPSVHGLSGAVAAFLFAGVLTMIAGLWRPLGRLAASIPAPLAQAMLAGVLLSLCIVPFQALAETPAYALPILLTWFAVKQVSKLFAVPAAVLVAALLTAYSVDFEIGLEGALIPSPVLTWPDFAVADMLGIGLPLFIITMAAQNIPGIAVLKSYGFAAPPGASLTTVGGFSVASALFGAPATCLAAITAAMCANEDSHPDPARRYWSAVIAGVFYCLFGVFAGLITAFAALAPPLVLGTLAGVALMGVFVSSATAALEAPDFREAAAVTFLVTASGVSILGLGAAVWGLLIGGAVHLVSQRVRRA